MGKNWNYHADPAPTNQGILDTYSRHKEALSQSETPEHLKSEYQRFLASTFNERTRGSLEPHLVKAPSYDSFTAHRQGDRAQAVKEIEALMKSMSQSISAPWTVDLGKQAPHYAKCLGMEKSDFRPNHFTR